MNNLSKDKKPYETPWLTVVTVRSELGYAASINEITGENSVFIGARIYEQSEGTYVDRNDYDNTFGDTWN